jgi:putative DNA primase/helicase
MDTRAERNDQYSSIELEAWSVLDDPEEPDESRGNYMAALAWLKKGYNVVPQKAVDKKHPGVKWAHLQNQRVTKDELLDWYPMFANGVGFITGAISGFIVIESDGPEGETVLAEFEKLHGPLPETLVIRSGSGRGLHRHFKHPNYKVKTAANPQIKLDIKGDGGFCILPPSRHKSGGLYKIVHNAEPAELPQGLLEYIGAKVAEADGVNGGTKAKERLSRVGDGLSALGEPPEYIGDLDWEPNIPPGETDRPPPDVETMRAMLEHLVEHGAFTQRLKDGKDTEGKLVKVGWTKCGMALKAAYGDEVGLDLWAATHIDEQARADAPAQWASFASEAWAGHVTIGTIIKAATDAGFSLRGNALETAIAASAVTTPLANEGDDVAPNIVDDLHFTGEGGDLYNGATFANLYRDKLVFIHETNEVLRFDRDSGWLAAAPGTAERAAKTVVPVLKDAGNGKAQLSHLTKLCDVKAQHAMIEMAKSEPGMTVRLSDFDTDPMLLGVANGVLDLAKGVLLPVSPDVLVSKRCNVAYDPDATCPRFKQFLLEVQPDAGMRAFLQRLLGYSLTGLVDEHIFVIFYGLGNNGKSVLIELIAWLLGDYAHKIATEMLMQHKRNPQGASPDIVALKGVRFAYANETAEGQRLDEARVKDMTGGDTLCGRVPYGKANINFRPTHKLVVVGNHKPDIGDTTHSMWRRTALVPFEQTIAEANRDAKLLEKLKAESPGILNWMLAGLREWRKNGLQTPEKIKAATAAYREEQDIIGDWIDENCKTGAGCSQRKTELYCNYTVWAEASGHRPLSQSKLTRRLNGRGFELAGDKRTVQGLALAHGLTRNV